MMRKLIWKISCYNANDDADSGDNSDDDEENNENDHSAESVPTNISHKSNQSLNLGDRPHVKFS